jgi:hypothetical protein
MGVAEGHRSGTGWRFGSCRSFGSRITLDRCRRIMAATFLKGDGAPPSARRASRSHDGTAAGASRGSENGEGIAESAQGCPTNTEGIPGNGQGIPPSGQGIPGSEPRSLTRAQGRPRCGEGCSTNFEGAPTNAHRSPRSSWSIRRTWRRRRSACEGRLCEDVGILAEERQKPSGLVGQPETQGETPSSRAGMLAVLGLQLSELAELLCVFVSTLAV